MKQREIVTGGRYTNATGTVRRVVGIAVAPRPKGENRDRLQYRVEQGRGAGRDYHCSREAFARWAAERVVEPAAA